MLSRCAVAAVTVLVMCQSGFPAAVNPADLIVSWEGYPSSYVQEYTRTGTLVQSWQITSSFSTEYARDVTMDSSGNIVIYNGTFSPSLTILNPVGGMRTNYSYPGWNTVNDVVWGTLAVGGGYAYAADQEIGSDSSNQNGIVRFNLANGSAQRFLAGTDTTAIGLGLDNRLYAVWPNSSPGGNQLDVLDPGSMTLMRTVTLPLSVSGVTADTAGNLYVTSGTTIYKLDSSGSRILASLDTQIAVDNLKISPTGQLISDNNGGQIVLSDTRLSSFTAWGLNEPNAQLFSSFANFGTPLPEPACALVGVILLAVLPRRRPSKRPVEGTRSALERMLPVCRVSWQ